MKKTCFCLIEIILFANMFQSVIIADESSAELIFSTGYENEKPVWEIKDSVMSAITKQAAKTGSFGLRITDADATKGSDFFLLPITINPGQTYRVSCWSRNISGSGISVYVLFDDLLGKRKKIDPEKETIRLDNNQEWKRYALVVTANKDVNKMVIWIHSYNQHMVVQDFDDILVEKVTGSDEEKKNMSSSKQAELKEQYKNIKFKAPSFPAGTISGKINRERIKTLQSPASLILNNEQLYALAGLIEADPKMHLFWQQIIDSMKELIEAGSFGTLDKSYIYSLPTHLASKSFVYAMTGDPAIKNFLKTIIDDAFSKPMEFWIHAEIRAFNPSAPVGCLETASMLYSMCFALDNARDIFDSTMYDRYKELLKEKAYIPCKRWLEKPYENNWLAVLSSCTWLAAKFYDDQTTMAMTEKYIFSYLDYIEADGSYGEQVGYFNYPIATLIPVFLAMDQNKLKDALLKSSLRGSIRWIIYHYFFDQEAHSSYFNPGVINFNDEDLLAVPERKVLSFLSYVYNQGLGLWLIDKYNSLPTGGSYGELLIRGAYKSQLKPLSPEEAKLPCLCVFSNGTAIIRSSWNPNDIVFALRSGSLCRTKYSHERYNKNAIALYAYGEYLVVAPGRANYRSPIRTNWDIKTSSHSTITFDQESQTKLAAKVVASWSGNHAHYIVSEAAECYANQPQHVKRSVVFIKNPGYFIVWDYISASKNKKQIDWQLLLYNFDRKSELIKNNDCQWSLLRPRTKLDIFTASTAGVKSYIEEGIMHIDYSYLKGIDKQGTPGSAIKLRLSTTEPTEQMSFISVLYPQAAGKTNERMKIQFQPEDPGRGRLEIKCDAFTDTVIFYTISDTKFPANRSAIDISRSDGSQVIFNIHLSEKPEKIHD